MTALAIFFPLLIFFSGACGLVYEVVWVRLFTGVFGNTTYSVTAVLSAFMGGLALGSALFGRRVDGSGRRLLLYGLLEVGIGLSALAVPFVMPLLQPVYGYLFNVMGFSDALLTAAKFSLSFLLMLIPSVLMGGTLPVMSRFYIRRLKNVGSRAGLLYGFNTLGATAGCFLAGFYFIEGFGVRGTVFLAAAVNLAIGVVSILLDRVITGRDAQPEKEIAPGRAASAHAGCSRVFFLALVGLAGFASLSYEVLWTRLLVFKLKTTVYAFSSMLTTFLLGIGLGSVVFSAVERRFKRIDYLSLWAVLQGGIAAAGFASIMLFGVFNKLPFSASTATGWTGKVVYTNFLPSIVIMLFPTLLMGVAFPAAVAACTGRIEHLGRSVGMVYVANTAGSILGSLATGFFLVTVLGTQYSLGLMVVLNALAAAAVLFVPAGGTPPGAKKTVRAASSLSPVKYGFYALPCLAVAAVLIMPPGWLFNYYNIGERRHNRTAVIDYAKEGLEGITTVHHFADGNRVISTGSINVAGTAFTLRTTQKLQAHIPMLLHPKPRLVCQIGFGSGETSRILISYGIARLDLVEISRSVIETSDRFFRDINGGVAGHPRFNAVIMDGANYFRVTEQTYDVIMNDSIWPYYAGNSGLYTREYFAAAKSRLREGGIMTSWVPIDMDLDSLVSLLKTFRAEFPCVGFWFATNHENLHALIAGSLKPMTVDPGGFIRRFERYARHDLAEIGYATPAMVLDIFKFDQSAIDGMDWDVPLHTEDRPYLEYAISRTTMHDMENALALVGLYRRPAGALLCRGNVAAEAAVLLKDTTALYAATGHVLAGMVKSARFDPRYLAEYRRALLIRPDYPGISRRVNGDKAPDPEKTADPRLLLSRARALLGEGMLDEAEAHAEKALQIDPGSGAALTLLGEVSLKRGRFDEAAGYLRKALKADPGRFDACYHLGWITLRRGDLDGAIALFEKGVDLNPNASELLYALGKACGFKKRFRKARGYFARAAKLTPFDGELYFEMGIIDEQTGQYGDARRNYEKALRFSPWHEGARRRLGLIQR